MSGVSSSLRTAPVHTNVRVVISHPTDVVASPKGLQIEGNLLTWDWIDNARRVVCPSKVEEKPAKKAKTTKSGASKKV
jgi:hypothetical protein